MERCLASLWLRERWILQGCILSRYGIGNRRFQPAHAVPLLARPRPPIAADLVNAPIYLQPVVVRIAEFDGQLATGAPASFKVDRHAMALQVITCPQHLI